MHLEELPPEGLLRRFRAAFPEAPIEAERVRRLAELEAGLNDGPPLAAPQREAMLARAGGAIHADILGKAIETAVAAILRSRPLRPAARPAITLEGRGADGRYNILIAIETLPTFAAPDIAGLTLTLPRAVPGPGEVEQALAALRRRHGHWAPAPAGQGAEPDDELTLDLLAWPAPNLLRNPGAQGGEDHPLGLPRHWEMLPHGALEPTIVAIGTGPAPSLDLRIQGPCTPDNRVFFAFDSWNAIPARPGQVFTFLIDLRGIAGEIPPDVEFELSLDEFAARQPGHAVQGRQGRATPSADADTPGLAAVTARLSDHPDIAHIRAALFIGGVNNPYLDFTIRIAAPCLISPLAPAPDAPPRRMEGLVLRLGAEEILPGLDTPLIGIRPGEARRVTLPAPLRQEAEWGPLAGRDIILEAQAKALRRIVLPPLDDSFAQRCGAADLPGLRASLEAELATQYAELGRRLLRYGLLERLAEKRPGESLPPSLVAREIQQAQLDDPRAPLATLTERAEARTRLRLTLRALGESLAIAVPAEDLAAALTREAAQFPGQEAEARAFLEGNAAATRRIADQLWTTTTIDRLLAIVQVSDRETTPDQLLAAARAIDADPGRLDELG